MNRILLGDIATSQTGPFGSQLHEEDYVLEGTPIVTVEHLGDVGFTLQNLPFVSDEDAERLKKYTLQEGDIVFSRVGAIDRSVYVKKEQEGWLFSGRCLRVRCDKSKINSRYLSYYFKQKEFKNMMLNVSVGATMPSLNTDIMNNIEIYAVDRDAQDKIADLLDAIDTKIEKNIFTITELESMAKTIYDYWFLQYDFPDENGKPYKSSGGEMVWNEELKKEIPLGWEVGKLEDFGTLSNGINYSRDEIGNKKYKIVNVRNMSNTSLLLEEADMDEIYLKAKVAENYLLKQDDILIARSGIPGAIRILEGDIANTIYCGFIICLSLKSYQYRKYLTYKLKDYENTTATTSGGTIMQNVSQSTLRDIKFAVPTEKCLSAFNEKIESIWKAMQSRTMQNKELVSLRSFLLPLLMNGQVGFRERQ